MAYTVPDVDDFKARFFRDFPYGGENGNLQQVQDADIEFALTDAGINFNEGLWGTQAMFSEAYLLLAAHFLVWNLRNSSQGIAGSYQWLETSKTVGSVSQGLTIPQQILDHPVLAMLSKTTYGAKYLFLLLPRLVGQIYTVCGATRP